MESISKRVTAVAFIGLVVLGNIWLMSMFTGTAPPAWTATVFFIFIAVAAMGGLGMAAAFILARKSNDG